MNDGSLTDYFTGVAVKKLAAVDAEPDSSNQHEVTGSGPLKRILGDRDCKLAEGSGFRTTFLWIAGENESVSEPGFISWYDSRRRHKTRSEWRLYYQGNSVTELMSEGDFLFVGRRPNDEILFAIVPESSEFLGEIFWLFDLPFQMEERFVTKETDSSNALDFAKRLILEELGVEFREPDVSLLESLVAEFGLRFPRMRVMSELARSSSADVSVCDDPDHALITWLDWENRIFHYLERKIISKRLQDGFEIDGDMDVEGFVDFSKSLRGRRSSRMGASLENHLCELFVRKDISFSYNAFTENNSQPDFIFPGHSEYCDMSFPDSSLTMLGAKSTCKDRWRQVLTEADRISEKHLLTLERSITENQTSQMQHQNLQLVVPAQIQKTYSAKQQSRLWSVADFIERVEKLQ